MKIIIVGCGKIGVAAIESLVNEGHDVIAVDNRVEVLEEIRDLYDKYKFDRQASDSMKNYTYELFLVCVLSAFVEHYGR